MKKRFTILGAALALFLAFACTIPSEIEIKGTPSFEIAVNMEFSEMFNNMLNSGFGNDNNKTRTLECPNAASLDERNIKTFLVHIDLFNEVVDIPGTVTHSTPLRDNSADPISLPLSKFGDVLEGFVFDETKISSSMFVSGTNNDFINSLDITVTVDSNPPTTFNKTPSSSGVSGNVYHGTYMPTGGEEGVFPAAAIKNKNDSKVTFAIAFKNSLINEAAWAGTSQRVTIELIIWLPMVFKADKAPALLTLPGFNEFGKFMSSIADSGMMESLNIKITMNNNPFSGGAMLIKSAGMTDIVHPMEANVMTIALNESQLKYIQEHEFKPTFNIRFDMGKELYIPKELRIITISMEMKIKHTVEM